MSDWRQRGACKGEDPELFFPRATGGKWSEAYQELVSTAKAVCLSCPVQEDCLLFAMDTHSEGIWAGTTDAERKDLRKAAA